MCPNAIIIEKEKQKKTKKASILSIFIRIVNTITEIKMSNFYLLYMEMESFY